ncbi:hypothetical protein V8C42DRAFT_354104 [Trichoderma barbatum]
MGVRRIAKEMYPRVTTRAAVPGHKDIHGNATADALVKRAPTHRTILHKLLTGRSRHGNFTGYHERFGYDANPLSKCGKPRSKDILCPADRPGFLPDVLDKDSQAGFAQNTYILRPKGYPEFQNLVEDTTQYGHPPKLQIDVSEPAAPTVLIPR